MYVHTYKCMYKSQSAYLEGRAVAGQGMKAYGNAEAEFHSFLNVGTL
jgi:hypothetical protein